MKAKAGGNMAKPRKGFPPHYITAQNCDQEVPWVESAADVNLVELVALELCCFT